MNFGDYFKQKAEQNKDLARDLKWLGCFVLKCELFDLFKTEINDNQKAILDGGYKKLKQNIPLAYITNFAPFFGMNFFVDKNVLIPRMETEILVDTIIKENKNKKNLKILDLCTGSGCIAITLKKYLDCTIFAVDVSNEALNIAQKNAKLNNVDINFVKSDMFDNIDNTFDIIVSNPPYICKQEMDNLHQSVIFEPKLALFGGDDGLDFYRIIAKNASKYLNPNGKLYLEIGFDQGKSVPTLLEHDFKNIKIIKDFDNLDRIVKCERR